MDRNIIRVRSLNFEPNSHNQEENYSATYLENLASLNEIIELVESKVEMEDKSNWGDVLLAITLLKTSMNITSGIIDQLVELRKLKENEVA